MNDQKQRLMETLEYMNEDQCMVINKLINVVSSDYISKGDLMKLAYKDNTTGIDSALPIDYVRAIEKVQPTFRTYWHCYNYQRKTWAQLDNIAEEVLNTIHETFKND